MDRKRLPFTITSPQDLLIFDLAHLLKDNGMSQISPETFGIIVHHILEKLQRVCKEIQGSTEMSGRLETNVFDTLGVLQEFGATQSELLKMEGRFRKRCFEKSIMSSALSSKKREAQHGAQRVGSVPSEEDIRSKREESLLELKSGHTIPPELRIRWPQPFQMPDQVVAKSEDQKDVIKRTQQFQESSKLRETVNEMRSFEASNEDEERPRMVQEFSLFQGLQENKKSAFS